MVCVHSLQDLSGWILPDSRFFMVKEWWHISGLYELRDEGYQLLLSMDAQRVLEQGHEESIRNFVSHLGFIKIARGQLDGEFINLNQLKTLKNLCLFLNPEEELDILSAKLGFIKKISIGRLLKLKNPMYVFSRAHYRETL